MARGKYSKQHIIQALKESKGLIHLAAKRVGCAPKTIYNYRDRYPEIEECIRNEREEFIDIAELSLYKRALDGDSWAVQFVLRTIGKDRGYSIESDVTVHHDFGVMRAPEPIDAESWDVMAQKELTEGRDG